MSILLFFFNVFPLSAAGHLTVITLTTILLTHQRVQVALVGLTPAPYLVAACGPTRGSALLAASASASALAEIAISPLVELLIARRIFW